MSVYLFAYGTLRPGLAPEEIAPVVERLRPLGEGFAFGKLYDLGKYPAAVFDPGSAWIIYGAVFELPEDAEVLRQLDAYEGPEYTRIEQLVTLVAGGVFSCWVYDYKGRPGAECLVEGGRWTNPHAS
ncbi:MAG: gamma-glutamylcyclotransferase family protein [Terracidiphilus sp.]